jgi:glycosyltransferase involved in cell wall biosynthesis
MKIFYEGEVGLLTNLSIFGVVVTKPILHMVFRKAGPQFNSIENVFNALQPLLERTFDLRRIELPFRTHGPLSMLRNRRFVWQTCRDGGMVHVTGHDNYVVSAVNGRAVLTLHDIGSAFTGSRLRDAFISRNWFAGPLARASAVTVISQFSLQELLAKYPSVADRCRVIPNPVDQRIAFTPAGFNSSCPTILQVGTKANKNLPRVAEALSGIPCKLLILGRPAADDVAILRQYNIDFETHFALPYEEVLALYRACDMVLFASLYEGFGMPVLEAQATGRPVVTSNVTALPDTAGRGACLVDPYSVQEIREAVLRVAGDAEYRGKLVARGRENVTRFTAESVAAEYMKLYSELIHRSE